MTNLLKKTSDLVVSSTHKTPKTLTKYLKIFCLSVFLITAVGCTKDSPKDSAPEFLQVDQDGEFGVIAFNDMKLKSFSLYNDETSPLNVIPSITGP